MVLARLSRLVLSALVVGGTLASPEEVCARHGGHEQTAAQGSGHDDHAGQHSSPTAPPCQRATPAECCPMLVTCSFSLAGAGGAEAFVPVNDRGAPQAGRFAAHIFRPSTPDPPPPKA